MQRRFFSSDKTVSQRRIFKVAKVAKLLLALAIVISALPSLATAAPKGSLKLSTKNMKKFGSIRCGLVKNSWIPGKLVKGYFYSYAAEVSNLKRSLKTAKTSAKAKIRAQITSLTALIKASTPVCNGQRSTNPSQIANLKFDLSGAKGLVLSDPQMTGASFSDGDKFQMLSGEQASSNIRKVLDGGGLAPVVVSGKAQISKFIVAPNDKLYVLFSNSCLNQSCSERCLLGEVDINSGDVACVDKELQSFTWYQGTTSNLAPSAKPIQFDGQGNAYYMGLANGGMTIVRKYNSSTKTREDLINENIYIGGFLVLNDGSLIYSGSIRSSGVNFLRKRRLDGSIEVIRQPLTVTWMAIFADGRVYVGADSSVYRMRQDSEDLEEIPWIGGQGYNRLDTASGGITPIFTSDKSALGLAGYMPYSRFIVQLFPVPYVVSSSVSQVFGAKPIGPNLLIYGADKDGNGILMMRDTKTGEEQDLLGSNKMDVYRVEYQANDNIIQFDGQRFSDGKYVLCSVYLSDNNALACAPTGSVKLADFQSMATPGVRIPPPPVTPTPIALMNYDFSDAKVLWGARKVTTDGSVKPALLDSEGRSVPNLDSDSGELWIRGSFYLTDVPESQCSLAHIAKVGGRPVCAFNVPNQPVSLVRSRGDGGAFFVASDTNNFSHVYFYSPGSFAKKIYSWGSSNARANDAIVSASGHLVLITNQWVKTLSTTGDILLEESISGNEPALSRLADGRILATEFNWAAVTLNPEGTQRNAQRYSYRDSSGGQSYDGEIECSSNGYYTCIAAGARAFMKTDFGLFSIHRKGDYSTTGLFRLNPGPLDEIVLSKAIQPDLGVARGNTLFISGLTPDGLSRVMSYNSGTATDQDLTDDPLLKIVSIRAENDSLYMLGTKPASQMNYCKAALVSKSLSGGGTTELYSKQDYCWNLTLHTLPKLIGLN